MKWLPLVASIVGGAALVFRQEGQLMLGLDETAGLMAAPMFP